jgi:U3 small nucleolar RNA-associated protein 21
VLFRSKFADSPPQFFDFHTTQLEDTLVLPSAPTSILLHRDSGLLAVICDDLVVRVVDIETRRIVRELKGFRGRILDVVCGFSFGSRSIVAQRNPPDFLPRFPMAGRGVPGLCRPHV